MTDNKKQLHKIRNGCIFIEYMYVCEREEQNIFAVVIGVHISSSIRQTEHYIVKIVKLETDIVHT